MVNIMVTVDGSAYARAAFFNALLLLRHDNDELFILTVAPENVETDAASTSSHEVLGEVSSSLLATMMAFSPFPTGLTEDRQKGEDPKDAVIFERYVEVMEHTFSTLFSFPFCLVEFFFANFLVPIPLCASLDMILLIRKQEYSSHMLCYLTCLIPTGQKPNEEGLHGLASQLC